MATNPFFDHVASPFRHLPLTLVRAAALNARLDEVTAGFDGVKAQLDLKAPAASPTFTGTVTFNTAALNVASGTVTIPSPGAVTDNSSRAATTAWVQSLVGSLSVGLPVQTANAGRYLRTDGISASWQHIVGLGLGTYQNVTSSTALTGDARNLDFTGAPAGTVATLPDATTLPLHSVFTLFGGVANVGIQSPAGELLLAGSESTGQQMLLTNNSTSEGSWRRILNTLQASDLPTTRQIVGQSTTLRASGAGGRGAAIPLGSDRVLVVAPGPSGLIEAYVVTATVNSVSMGAITNVSAASVHWLRVLQVTGGFVVAWTTSASAQIQVSGLAVSGTTVTASAATGIGNAIESTSALSMVDVAIEASGAAVVALYRRNATTVEAVAATFSGSAAPTVGSAVTFLSTTNSIYGSAALASASGGVLVGAYTCEDAGPTQIASARVLTLTGASISLGAALSLIGTLVSGHGPIAAARASATTVLLVTKRTTGTDATAAVATISGTSLTLGSVLTWANNGDGLQASTAGAFMVAHAVDVGSGNFFVAVGASTADQTRIASLNVSGTTVTRNGSSQQASQLTSSMRPVSPQSGWVAFSLGGAFAVGSFVPCGASGIGGAAGFSVTLASGSFSTASGVSPHTIGIVRLQSGKRLMLVTYDGATRAAVAQYGGLAP